MADANYTYEKLGEAVQALATGKGRIKDRLVDAIPSLALVDVAVIALAGMSEGAAALWGRISAGLFDGGRGQVDELTEDDAADIAQAIVSLDAMVGSYVEDSAAGRR